MNTAELHKRQLLVAIYIWPKGVLPPPLFVVAAIPSLDLSESAEDSTRLCLVEGTTVSEGRGAGTRG